MTIEPGFVWTLNCRDCFHCKQKTFRDYGGLVKWLDEKEFTPRKGWQRNFAKEQKLTMYWCSKQREFKPKALAPGRGTNPKEFCSHIYN